MDNLTTSLLQTDFSRFFKRLLIAALAIFILGGLGTGLAFRTQLSEGLAYVQTVQTAREQWRQARRSQLQGGEGVLPYQQRGQWKHAWRPRLFFTEPSLGAKLAALAYGSSLALVAAVYWLAVAAWLYKGAVLAGLNRWLWLLAGLLFNVLAVLLFLLVRDHSRVKCEACGAWQPRAATYCASCGALLQKTCSGCGTSCKLSALYCSCCGKKLPGEGA